MECLLFSDLRILSLCFLCVNGFLVHHSFHLSPICTGLVSRDKNPQVITKFYLSPHSLPTFEVVLTRFGSLIHLMYLLAINQALPYGCSFVLTYKHPEGSAAGDITIIWNDVFKESVDCAHPFLSLFIFFCHHHHMECFLFSDLRIFSLYIYIGHVV